MLSNPSNFRNWFSKAGREILLVLVKNLRLTFATLKRFSDGIIVESINDVLLWIVPLRSSRTEWNFGGCWCLVGGMINEGFNQQGLNLRRRVPLPYD